MNTNSEIEVDEMQVLKENVVLSLSDYKRKKEREVEMEMLPNKSELKQINIWNKLLDAIDT